MFSLLSTQVRLEGNNPEIHQGEGVWSESGSLLRFAPQVSLDVLLVLSGQQLFVCKAERVE